ncbi:MAG TPA: cation-translocating P-type ATPase [Nevskiaceae bacterium]|nr:cation-translocating P-type ATPase [Nevskiaceae bacterium]
MTSLAAPEVATGDTHLLSAAEQWSLGVRLTLSLAAAGCLVVASLIGLMRPGQQDVAELAAGLGAALVAVPALAAAWHSLRRPSLHGITDQLIALALLAAWAAGDLFTAALLPLVMMLGHILEERSLLGSQEAIRALSRLTETAARRLSPSGLVEEVAARALRVDDRIELRAGDRVPADGIVETGQSSVDTASITGESVPEEVVPGSEIYNGSINLDGHLIVRITRVGAETTLGRVVALLRDAEQAKPPVTRLLERYSQRYLILVLLLAAGTWFATGKTAVVLAVLVASCPCALVLAAPATSIAALSVASRHGILVKGAAFLETLASVDAVAFDKTGTMTIGQLKLAGVETEPGIRKTELIALAANLGTASSHPVSRALAAGLADGERLNLEDIQETRGLGVTARLGGERVAMGRAALFESLQIAASAPPTHDGPVAGVARGKRFLGWVLLADEPRPEAATAVDDLRALGLDRQLLITGDRWPAARRVAEAIAVTDVQAELLPAQKMECVLQLSSQGYRPLVVGDGINDALALKAGAVGVAMGGHGTDVALASADLVLMTNDLRRLGTCIRLSRRCRRTIYINIGLGLIWTMVMLFLAVTGVLGVHGALIAALAQNFSSVLVMINAGRLLKFQELLS